MIKAQIPNIITLLNLISGSISIVYALEGNLTVAAWFIGIAAIFDFFDGFAARMLHVSSEIGKELDSLADVISFGLAPGMILYILLSNSGSCPGIIIAGRNIVPFIAFLIPALSAYRLAKFNLDKRQTDSFIGLPTPANALMIASFPLITAQQKNLAGLDTAFVTGIINNPWFLIIFILVFSSLLVAGLPLMSLKFKTFIWGDNKVRYLFLMVSVILFILLFYTAVPLIIVFYVLLSLFTR